MQVQIPAGTAPNAVLQVRAPDGAAEHAARPADAIKVRRAVDPASGRGQQMRIAVPAAAWDKHRRGHR